MLHVTDSTPMVLIQLNDHMALVNTHLFRYTTYWYTMMSYMPCRANTVSITSDLMRTTSDNV